MCVTGIPSNPRIPAQDYLGDAKRRSAQLKPLRSVSRAYRQSQVREIKMRAIARKETEDVSRKRAEEANRRALEASIASYGGPGGIVTIAGADSRYLTNNGGNLYAQQQYANYITGLGRPSAGVNNLTQVAPTAPLPQEIKAGEITAWRVWLINQYGKLTSTAMDTVWEDGAVIEGNVDVGEGVHAWKDEASARSYARSFHGTAYAIGTVELWGKVIEHESGYRAQFAEVKDIVEKDLGFRSPPRSYVQLVTPYDSSKESPVFPILMCAACALAIGLLTGMLPYLLK